MNWQQLRTDAALIIAGIALIFSAFQALMSWQARDDFVEANVLSTQLQICTELVRQSPAAFVDVSFAVNQNLDLIWDEAEGVVVAEQNGELPLPEDRVTNMAKLFRDAATSILNLTSRYEGAALYLSVLLPRSFFPDAPSIPASEEGVSGVYSRAALYVLSAARGETQLENEELERLINEVKDSIQVFASQFDSLVAGCMVFVEQRP